MAKCCVYEAPDEGMENWMNRRQPRPAIQQGRRSDIDIKSLPSRKAILTANVVMTRFGRSEAWRIHSCIHWGANRGIFGRMSYSAGTSWLAPMGDGGNIIAFQFHIASFFSINGFARCPGYWQFPQSSNYC